MRREPHPRLKNGLVRHRCQSVLYLADVLKSMCKPFRVVLRLRARVVDDAERQALRIGEILDIGNAIPPARVVPIDVEMQKSYWCARRRPEFAHPRSIRFFPAIFCRERWDWLNVAYSQGGELSSVFIDVCSHSAGHVSYRRV